MIDYMPTKNASETIEALTRKLDNLRFYNSLRDCETLEDFKELTEKYKIVCEEDEKNN